MIMNSFRVRVGLWLVELRGLELVIVYTSSDLLEPLVDGNYHAINLAQVYEICSCSRLRLPPTQ